MRKSWITISTLLILALAAGPVWAKPKVQPKDEPKIEGKAETTAEAESGCGSGCGGCGSSAGTFSRRLELGDGKTVVIQGEVRGSTGEDGRPRFEVETGQGCPGITIQAVEVDAAEVPASGGWLGVQITTVPAAVAAQLGLKDKGVMVGNLVRGSPADKAGLDRYDVIVGVGRAEPIDSVEAFIASIGAHKPGEKISLAVIQSGKRRNVQVALGKSKPAGQLRYAYEQDADELWQDQFRLHGGKIHKGPGGWEFEGGKGGFELPKEVLEGLSKHPFGEMQIEIGGEGMKSRRIRRTVDGETIDIEKAKDGSIAVSRTKKGQDKPQVRKYKNEPQLQKEDPEAYKLYKNMGVSGGVRAFVLPGHGLEGGELRLEGLKDLPAEIKVFIERAKEQAKDASQAARMKIARAVAPAGPKYQFDVDPDGPIRVQVADGDSKADITFKSEEDMKKRAPKMYEAYQKLLK